MHSGAPETELDKTLAAEAATSPAVPGESDATVAHGPARSASPSKSAGPEPPLVAGYEVVRLLGQGGMGVVWEAVDHRLGRTVALKVHGDVSEGASDALWIEARLAAKIAHPGIVPIHEVGFTMSGQPYYTMDLVEGTSLRVLLREGSIAKLKALSIARAVAEAIGAAHSRGIVHCDLKPGNIVIDSDGRARVLDFGLAFAMSGMVGQAFGPMRGSPPYMSPEQIAGEPLTAATDVYSLGVVLYEMLTGGLPFEGNSTEELLAQVALHDAPPPSKKNPALGDEIDRLCAACLHKHASKRLPDGRAVARELKRLLEGEAESPEESLQNPAPRRISSRPAPPEPALPGESKTYRFEMHLAAPPSRLWPLVSNTERFNRAVGLPTVTFAELPEPAGAARKSGRFRVLGMDVSWEEHPFEWVHEHGHSVYRRYTKGPLSWLKNRVSLVQRDDGGTDVVHEVEAAPRGALGRLAAAWEIQWKLGRKLEAVYKRMDEAARHDEVELDPFEPPHAPSSSQTQRVATGLARLLAISERRFSAAQLDKLRDVLLHAPDKRIERMRPYAIADAWGERRAEVLDMFLHAANAGLVDILWDLVCPGCYVAHEVASSLRHVAEQGSCAACGESYTRDLVGSVELIFRPHREVRDIATATYCTGSPAMRPHVLAQQILPPRERREITLSLGRGEILVRVERRPLSAEISSSPAGISDTCEVRVGEAAVQAAPAIVRSGEVRIVLVNDTEAHQVLRIERPPRKSDSVTAATAMTHPTFQGFFSEELLAEGEHLRVSHMAFVAVDIEDRARVLRDRGDAIAFARFTELSERVAAAAAREQGAVFRAAFDATLAAFSSAAAAVRAAIALAGAAQAADALQVRIAVHSGRCIAVNRGARIEYFGETIERTVALLSDARAGSFAVSSAVDDDPAALSAMQAPGVERKVGTSRSGDYGGRRVTRVQIS